MLRRALITCAVTSMLGLGVLAAKARVYVSVAPPAAVVETPGTAPAAGYVWTPGYYRWDGNNYVWTGGVWVVPPHRHAHWVAGRWVHHHHQYYFQEGYWRG
jgi:WXXGXW repeat (2 copies)